MVFCRNEHNVFFFRFVPLTALARVLAGDALIELVLLDMRTLHTVSFVVNFEPLERPSKRAMVSMSIVNVPMKGALSTTRVNRFAAQVPVRSVDADAYTGAAQSTAPNRNTNKPGRTRVMSPRAHHNTNLLEAQAFPENTITGFSRFVGLATRT